MDKPGADPLAVPEEPQASRATTIVLIVSLVLVVLLAGVAGTVAVLMTRSPDTPLLGGAPPLRLATPIHFAPVRETKAAPCPGAEAVLDEKQTTCYLLEDGVTVNAVQRIEPVREKNGTYSVRVAIAPAFRDKVAELIDELVSDQRQVAVILVPATVVAAPIVTQSMDGDSLSIAGFTKEEADAITARLLSSPPATGTPETGAPDTGAPATGGPGSTDTGSTGTGSTGTGSTGTGVPDTGVPQTSAPDTGGPASTGPVSVGSGDRPSRDRRYASCKEAVAAGDGPYTKGVHPEYAWYTDVDGNGVACNSPDIR
ncbi:excalibur calcium-binding domain-containing protein [Nonomuraea sp. NPDC048916]|uniref:excalibur calcium-binding domain-containing protein n=1 Tax=Nonomuraea sp. NPDC048916 TaxID=3154232 RepID=UPI0033C31330